MEDVRRSGRKRNKGPVTYENTVEKAIDADVEDSDDDFENANVVVGKDLVSEKVDKGDKVTLAKRKKVESKCVEKDDGKKVKRKKGESSEVVAKPYVFQTRTSPKMLFNVLQTLLPAQKACLEQMGFEGMLDMKLDGIPSKIGFYAVDQFNPDKMEMKLKNSSIVITKQLIGELLGIRNEGRDLMDDEIDRDEGLIGCWSKQFQEGKDKTTGILKGLIRKSKVADMNFKLNFIVLFTNVMGRVNGKGILDLSVLNHINSETDLSIINWCDYVLRCLRSCKEGWNREMSNSYFLGPLTLLTMVYVDGTICDRFNVPRVRPPIRFWTYELLKERETEEIESGSLGMGELAGPYVEEDIDSMPEDEEGIIWKLNKIVNVIRTQRKCFEKTLEAGGAMFPGNMMMSDLKQQYRSALLIKEVDEERRRGKKVAGTTENLGLHDEDGSKSKGGIELSNNDPFDSPEFSMGPETQLVVFRSADKACADFYDEKNQKDMGAPSFSIGLTQDPLFSPKEVEKLVNVESITESVSPVKALPIRSCEPKVVRDRRVCGKAVPMLSPYVSRVININSRFTLEEKQVDQYLMNTDNIDFSDVVFETTTGVNVRFHQIMTLLSGGNIDNCVVDAWCSYLNSLEQYKDPANKSRFYLPMFAVDKMEINNDSRLGSTVQAFLMNVEMMTARGGKHNMLKDVDLVFIPVCNGDHKFVVCFDVKNPVVMMFDNKKLLKKDGTSCMRVATILHKQFGNFLRNKKHAKADAILKTGIIRGEFNWQTDKRPNDCGVFVMRHMEDYMGNTIVRWDCGLEADSRKLASQLVKLRKKYAARLLLSECNKLKDKFMADMCNFQVAKDVGKNRNLLDRGV